MAYTYDDWPTKATPKAQLDQLNLHIQEVSARIDRELSSSGHSQSSSALTSYHARLLDERADLMRAAGVRRSKAYARKASFRV